MATDDMMMALAERDAKLPKCHCGATAYIDDVNGITPICMVCFNLWEGAGEPEKCPCGPIYSESEMIRIAGSAVNPNVIRRAMNQAADIDADIYCVLADRLDQIGGRPTFWGNDPIAAWSRLYAANRVR